MQGAVVIENEGGGRGGGGGGGYPFYRAFGQLKGPSRRVARAKIALL